jgi:hypothetical protein
MKLDKASALVAIVERQKRYGKILEKMRSGYSDEWEFRNSHTGATVDFSCDDWDEIKTMVQRKYDEATKQIEEF